MGHLRICIGEARFKNVKNADTFNQKLYSMVKDRMVTFKQTTFQQLLTLKDELTEDLVVDGQEIILTTYMEKLSESEVLIALQTAYKTFKFPNYFSLNFIGKVFVEGVVVNSNNESREPADKLLRPYK